MWPARAEQEKMIRRLETRLQRNVHNMMGHSKKEEEKGGLDVNKVKGSAILTTRRKSSTDGEVI